MEVNLRTFFSDVASQLDIKIIYSSQYIDHKQIKELKHHTNFWKNYQEIHSKG